MKAKLGPNLEINYEVYGQGGRILLLHGWGADFHSFDYPINKLSEKFQVIAIDLPGFGRSTKPESAFSVLDYAYTVEKFLEYLDTKEVVVLGHSFGGAVALTLASFSKRVRKLILADSSGIRHRGLFVRLKILLYKIVNKRLPSSYRETIVRIIGSVDYKKAGSLRNTLVKVVNEDLRYILERITIPTLIIWGERDEITTFKEARILNSGIKNSSVLILRDCGHFPHLEKPDEFVKVVTEFLNEP